MEEHCMSNHQLIFWLLGAFFCVAIANSITAAHQKKRTILLMMMVMLWWWRWVTNEDRRDSKKIGCCLLVDMIMVIALERMSFPCKTCRFLGFLVRYGFYNSSIVKSTQVRLMFVVLCVWKLTHANVHQIIILCRGKRWG